MQHDLLFLWPFLSLLQVCIVGGASSVLNGAVGESIVLPAGVDGTVQAKLLQWSENNKVIIQSAKKRVQVLDQRLEGRATMSNETGDLTISSLREEDSGKYVFNGVGSPSSESILPKEVELHVYERISKVQVDSQVKNSTNSSSCSVTLSCSVLGGSQVALSWSRDGQRIAEAEKRTTLTVSPSREELYSCTASNPVSSLTGRVTVPPCQTHAPPPGLSMCELKAVLFSVGLVAMVSAVIAVNVRSALQENQNQTRTRTRSRAEWKSQDSPTEEEEEGL